MAMVYTTYRQSLFKLILVAWNLINTSSVGYCYSVLYWTVQYKQYEIQENLDLPVPFEYKYLASIIL